MTKTEDILKPLPQVKLLGRGSYHVKYEHYACLKAARSLVVGRMNIRPHPLQPRVILSRFNEDVDSSSINPTNPRDRKSLSPEASRAPLDHRRLRVEDDEISIHTQNDRGYAAAGRAFDKGMFAAYQDTGPVIAESDFGQMGTHLQGIQPDHAAKTTYVKSMALEVLKSLEKYDGRSQGPRWLPVNHLFRIITRDSVLRALKESLQELELSQGTLERYAEAVCPSIGSENSIGSRSMFAILTILNRAEEILEYVDLELSDDNLPFVAGPDQLSQYGQLFPKGVQFQHPYQSFGHHWTFETWGALKEWQKIMRSPFFAIDPGDRERDIPHYELEPDTVLPFIKEFPATSSTMTSYSKVQRVQIHMHHHTMYKGFNDENPCFAVKELLPELGNQDTSRELNFKEEVRALAKTVGLSSHDHVIKLLATWRRGDSWSMLFPWARSNLKDYWLQESPDPKRSPEFVQWMSTQCRGLAEGLKKIHKSPSNHLTEEFGIHGDIKPENILLFDSKSNEFGTMVISDFGYTRFHGRNTRSNTPVVGFSPTHRAPELDLEQTISRSYDMWTFGCVFLEFITWYLKGPDGIEQFVNQRIHDDKGAPPGFSEDKFFNINNTIGKQRRPIVKRSVEDRI
ncbi:protein kinase [Colletotrichum filicis]|nr:protein kinase [Colletotrichum filicis]